MVFTVSMARPILCVSSTNGTQIYNEDATALIFYLPMSAGAASSDTVKYHQAGGCDSLFVAVVVIIVISVLIIVIILSLLSLLSLLLSLLSLLSSLLSLLLLLLLLSLLMPPGSLLRAEPSAHRDRHVAGNHLSYCSCRSRAVHGVDGVIRFVSHRGLRRLFL